ncbi:ATP-binding protein [Trinickia fusca]|uniref:Virulence sensor protein BvgS n=1 Tax=Trinickia fusca TaxID=2419777 RepID=A0A494XJ71_9BURK|nr:transporter substrate-binding domain-containing protein [Trinickia fusca]RKP48159.1 response regulator [Trinickia fusca]
MIRCRSSLLAWIWVVASALCLPGEAWPAPAIQLVSHWHDEVPALRLSNTQREWLARHHGVLRVGVVATDEAGPLDMIDGAGNYEGISAEYLGIVEAALRVRVEVAAFADRRALIEALQQGRIDIATAARRSRDGPRLSYSEPYLGNKFVVATRADNPNYAIRADAGDHVLAYEKGSVNEAFLERAYPDMRLLALPSLSAALDAVAFGQAQACLGNATIISYLIEQRQLLNVSVTNFAPVHVDEFRFASASGNEALVQLLDNALSGISSEVKAVIRTRWEGLGAHYAFKGTLVLTPAERAWIAQHPVVKYQVTHDHPPFVIDNEDGTVMGFGVDLLDLIAAQTGLRFQPVLADIDIDASRANRGDTTMLIASVPGEAALRDWRWSQPYSSTPDVIVARPGREYRDLASLRGMKIALGPHLTKRNTALEGLGVSVVAAHDIWSAASLVAAGKADALVTNLATANYIISTQFRSSLAIVGRTGMPNAGVAFAVRPGDAALVAILDKALAAIPLTRMDQLHNRWQFSRHALTTWDRRRPLILMLILGAVSLAALFFVWNHALRRQIRRRKAAEADMRAAMRSAEDANRAKSTFLATMSHEIRTPMNAVLGVLELLRETRGTVDAQSESIDAAHDSARALLSLIEDILDLSKIESGKLELSAEPTDCDALVRSVATVFGGLARQKHLRLNVHVDSPQRLGALIDPVRLRQILSNLLSNAVKFTEAGEVSLIATIRQDEREHEQVRIDLRISDTGIGISTEDQAKLFQPFAQADATVAVRFGGSGLGLSICRRLVELMGGTLTLASAPGEGTTIDIALRVPHAMLGKAQELNAEPVGSLRDAFSSRSALIVDDHPANRFVLSRQLAYLGFGVTCAEGAREALARWSSGQFDVVMTDCFMPDMTGYELTRELRAAEAASGRDRTIVIGCTANVQQETLHAGLDAGMDLCVTKPLGLAMLANQLSALLGHPSPLRPSPGEEQQPAHLQHPIDARATIEGWIDSSAIERIVGGDTSSEIKLLSMIAKANRDDLVVLRQAVADDDRSRFSAALHHLRGGIRLIGASVLEGACREAEHRERDGLPLQALAQAIVADVERLDDMLERRMAALRPGACGKQQPAGTV